jgi:hypothetical protein
MSTKKANHSNWLEIIGYSVAILVGIGWGLSSINFGINSGTNFGTKEAPKSQEQRSPSAIDSQYQ